MSRDKQGHHGRIMDAAWREFLAHGYKDASMRRIADAAGMSVSGLYKHFSGKEQMFSALVGPACDGLMERFRQELEAQRALLESGDLERVWESGGDASLAMDFIYGHYDAFRLIVCGSEGTPYEHFLHDLALLEEETTLAFMDMMRRRGKKLNDIDMREFHLLATANVNAVFQAVEHGFTRDRAMHYAQTLDRFFAAAWQVFFGY